MTTGSIRARGTGLAPSPARIVGSALAALVVLATTSLPSHGAEPNHRALALPVQPASHDLLLVPRDLAERHLAELELIHEYADTVLARMSSTSHLTPAESSRIARVQDPGRVTFRHWSSTYGEEPPPHPERFVVAGFNGPVDPAWTAAIESFGCEIVDTAAPYSLVLSAPKEALSRLGELTTSAGFAAVRGYLAIPDDARIDPQLLPLVDGAGTPRQVPGLRTSADGRAVVQVFGYRPYDQAAATAAARRHADAAPPALAYGHSNAVLVNGPELAAMLAGTPEIAWIQAVYERRLLNNLAAKDYITNVAPVWADLGWDGTGVIVDHNDSGVDLAHADFFDGATSIVVATSGTMSNTDSAHGTHTAGSVAGRGVAGTYPPNTSGCGDQTTALPAIKGMAPGSRLAVNNIFDGGVTNERGMMEWGWKQGALLSTNSWGYGTMTGPTTGYIQQSVEIDLAVRDADTTAAGNQQLSILFAAGNDGPSSATIGAPGNAKNTINVGASQNDRCGSYINAYCAGPDIDSLACFSSRGPSQDRVKPDVTAPGTDVISVESGDPSATNDWDTTWTGSLYALMPGTSMATPIVAGATAVFYEFFGASFGAAPSPALAKAAMINGAVDMGFGYPSYDQGWGRINLRDSIEGPTGGQINFVEQGAAALVTGASWSQTFHVFSSSPRLKITLVWTDPPAASGSSSPLVNDLDLVVTAPDGTVYRGNRFTAGTGWSAPNPGVTTDTANNVENVFVATPATGQWTITVTSADTQTNPPGLGGQDFALVYSGDCADCIPPAAPTGVAAASNGDNRIDVTWTAVGGGVTEYRVYRSTISGGPYTLVGTVPAPGSSFADTTVHGGITYYYVVRSFLTCESPLSGEASATATGSCTLPSTFAGLTSVANPFNATCTLDLAWDPGVAQCGGPVTYTVYRSETPGFTPGPSAELGSGITCSGTPCTWSDADSLISGTTYYYVVRAVDGSNGVADGNTTERYGTPTGPLVDGTYVANAEAGSDPIYTTGGWSVAASPVHAGAGSYFSGHSDTSCTALYAHVTLTAGQVSSLTYWTQYTIESRYDGGVVQISTDGSSWTSLTPSPGYPNTFRSSSDACGYPTGEACYTGTNTSWTQYTIDLSGYAGQTVYLAWWYSTDGSLGGPGWYLDDIQITHVQMPSTCATGGGCTDPGAPVITTVADGDACAQSGVTVGYTAGSGATSHDLYVDGGLAVAGYASGALYDPGDTASHSYVVRAVDGSCSTDSAPSAFTDADGTPATPAAPTVADLDACAQTGVQVSWGAVAGATAYDLLIDGTTTLSAVTSPYPHDPGDTATHDYQVRARTASCTGAWSAATPAADADGLATPAAPSVTDADGCASTGVQVSWSAVTGATAYDILVDGTTTVAGVSSPYTHPAGDTASHTYQVRARSASCTGAWSAATAGADADGTPDTPTAPTVTDPDACASTGVQVTWSAITGATAYDLLVDGATTIAGVSSPYTHSPGDAASHTYQVRARTATCTGAWSPGAAGSDADGTPGAPVITSITDPDDCAQSGLVISYTGGAGATSHDLYVDGALAVAGFASGATYAPGDGVSHTYAVRAMSGACSTDSPGQAAVDGSNCTCTAAPSFAGSVTVSQITGATVCGLHVEWPAATSGCPNGPGITYTVYRSTAAGFDPDLATPIATCVAATSYDDVNVTLDQPAYYVVRAEDGTSSGAGACNAGNLAQLAEASGTASSGSSSTQLDDPLQATSTFATSDLSPTTTFPDVATATLSFALSHTVGGAGEVLATAGFTGTAGGTDLRDLSPGATTPIGSAASAWFTYTVTTFHNKVTAVRLRHVASGNNTALATPTANGLAVAQDLAAFYNANGPGTYRFEVSNGNQGPVYADISWTITGSGAGGDVVANTQVELVDPFGVATPVKAYGAALASPYDVTALYTGPGTYRVRVSENAGGEASLSGAGLDLQPCSPTLVEGVQVLTARSTDGELKAEWVNPSAAVYGTTSVQTDPVTPLPSGGHVLVTGLAGGHGAATLAAGNDADHTVTAWVNSLADGSGIWSPSRSVGGRPFVADAALWAYSTGASSLAPPGLMPGAIGTGAVYAVANDRLLHAMNPGAAGGDWPGHDPAPDDVYAWRPLLMNGPAVERPPVIPLALGTTAAQLVFLASQDGSVYAVDASTGGELWRADLGVRLHAAPAGVFSAWGGADDLLFVGTRDANGPNALVAVDPMARAEAWRFTNTLAQGGSGDAIGIVSSAAVVDYAASRVYFASRAAASGSSDTVWCVGFASGSPQLLWSAAVGDVDGSPALASGRVYVGTNAGHVVALDAATGAALWSFPFETFDGPVKDFVWPTGGTLYFSTTTRVWAVSDSGAAGTAVWWRAVTAPSAPLVDEERGQLLVGTGDGTLARFALADGTPGTATTLGDGAAAVGCPAFDHVNTLVYVGTEAGTMWAVTP